MNELALFAGSGGGLLGTKLLGWETICAVERDKYCQEVLLQRQRDGLLDKFPIWDEAATFDGKPWRGIVDCVTAGFPCQPFSFAGRQQAANDPKNAWPDTIRIIREVRPEFVFLENVPSLVIGSHGYFGTVLGDLAKIGFHIRWTCFPASAIGAPHKRDRVWIVANANGAQFQGNKRAKREIEKHPNTCFNSWWKTESGMDRISNGVAHRVDRLRAIGNGQVPCVVKHVWEELVE